MLFIFFGIAVASIVIGLVLATKFDGGLDGAGGVIAVIGSVFTVIWFIVLLIVVGRYNAVKTTALNKIAVYQEQNDVCLAQLEPLVDKYVTFEKDVITNVAPSSEKLLLLNSAYPELKSDQLVQTQITTVLNNQARIRDYKLSLANLDSYKLWIFMGGIHEPDGNIQNSK